MLLSGQNSSDGFWHYKGTDLIQDQCLEIQACDETSYPCLKKHVELW